MRPDPDLEVRVEGQRLHERQQAHNKSIYAVITHSFDIYYTSFSLSSSSLTGPGPTPYPDFNVTPPAPFPYLNTNNPHLPHPSCNVVLTPTKYGIEGVSPTKVLAV
ncbi:hypothetical protein D9758_016143 [Tetrapyrgos nigripes]|uniref:Uncharacterized protein n=1 Tax=Tetrapyrgos nigripes TaxID=182062 RepID=A0A8H5CA18_9AGAR|nr:hypothetical protein D9758_016143 [Tetrapyrgos nigripes]